MSYSCPAVWVSSRLRLPAYHVRNESRKVRNITFDSGNSKVMIFLLDAINKVICVLLIEINQSKYSFLTQGMGKNIFFF